MFYIALIYLDFEIVYSAMWVYNELTKKGGGESDFCISCIWFGITCTITIQSSHFGDY